MTRAGIMNQIDTRLSTITSPSFVAVYRGEPLSISGTPVMAFWIENRRPMAQTLTNNGSITTFSIRAYFRVQTSPDVRESAEEDLWDAMYEIDSALMGDASLDGNATDTRLLEADAGYVSIGGSTYRTLTVPYEVDILEDVTVTP